MSSRKVKSEEVIRLELARDERLSEADKVADRYHRIMQEVEHINETIAHLQGEEEYAWEREMPSDAPNYDRWNNIYREH